MKKHIIINSILITCIAVILFLLCLFNPYAFMTSANEVQYSNVLNDLKKDESFNIADYPVDTKDNSLSVITVAEGKNLELYVYVYVPSQNYTATSINISTTINNKLNYKNYLLSFVNKNGVLQKYIVKDFIVNSDDIRYYEISSIFRRFDSKVDKGVETFKENSVEEVAFEVGKLFTYENIKGYDVLKVEDIELIKVTEKYVGFMRYEKNSFNFTFAEECFDVHYVAFSTDRQIDDLLEADVFYKTQDYRYHGTGLSVGDVISYGDITEKYAYLKKDKDIEAGSSGWFNLKYNWKSIETGQSFINSEHATYTFRQGVFNTNVTTRMTSEELTKYVGSCDWVLRFAVTEWGYFVSQGEYFQTIDEHHTIVGDVTILRLKFMTDGKVYNLGVVDNKQTGSSTPDNETEVETEIDWEYIWSQIKAFMEKIGKVLILIVLIVVIGAVLSLLSFLFPVVGKLLSALFHILWFLICLPFKLIGKLFKKKKE